MGIAISRYLRLTGLLGRSYIDDDYYLGTHLRDYAYQGWEAKIIVAPIPATLEVGLRADGYQQEYYQNGNVETLTSFTVGVSIASGSTCGSTPTTSSSSFAARSTPTSTTTWCC